MTRVFSSMVAMLLTMGFLGAQSAASPLEIGAYDARALSMGGAQTAATRDHSATLYNPAALTTAPASVSIGWMAMSPSMEISLDRPATSQRSEPVSPDAQSGVTIGAVFPLGGGIGNRFALGIGIYAPADYLARGQLLSAQTPRFYRFQNRAEKFVGLGALGFRVSDGIHLGVGSQLIGDLLGDVAVDVRLSDRQVVRRDVYVEQPLKVAAIVGLLLEPGAGIRVGACWRQDINLEFSLPSQLIIDDAAGLRIDLGGVALYTPESWTLGLAWDALDGRLQLSGEVSWIRWSNTPDPSLQLGLDTYGSLVDALGLEDRLDLRGSGAFDLAMRDIWQPRFGVEYRLSTPFALRAGYTWRQSPAPLPTGAFNFVDPPSHQFSVGMGIQWPNPWEEDERPLHFDVGYSAILLEDVSVTKRAGKDDPVGDFNAGGQLQTFSLSLKQEL